MNRFVSVQVKCAGCGAQFGEANHRFVLRDCGPKTYTLTRNNGLDMERASCDPLYAVRRFDPAESLNPDDYPVCGEKCLSTLEGQIIAGKKL
jgi:hypothetical protein